jgi:glyoxylase-like metal-dependent hydrolase (beta-lactamase superfamily II)
MPRCSALCFGLTLVTVALRPAPAQGGPFDVETVRVADGIYAFIETKQNPIVSGNIIAVIGDDGVLIYDAGHHPPVTRSIIAGLKRITSKPVRYVVVSHWHDDHWGPRNSPTPTPGSRSLRIPSPPG